MERLILLILLLTSCDQGQDNDFYIKKFKSVLDIDYPKDFQLVMYESTDETVEKFQLQYSFENFQKIISQLDTTKMEYYLDLNIYYVQFGNYMEGVSVMFYMDRQIVQYSRFKD